MPESMLLVGDSQTNDNLFYSTRFLAGDPFLYLQMGDERLLVVSSMEAGRARNESNATTVKTFDDFGYVDLMRQTNDRARAFAELIARIVHSSGAAAAPLVVESTFPVYYADILRASDIQLNIISTLLVAERRCKSTEEIEAIERAQRATEEAVTRAIDMVAACDVLDGGLHYAGVPLTSERLRSEIEVTLTRQGLDPSDPIVAGGRGAADPHWLGAGMLRAGEAIVLDVFPRDRRSRHWADMTRTVVKGEPSEVLRGMYAAVLRAQEEALSRIGPGVNGRDIHQAVEAVFTAEGYAGEGEGPRYIHGTGHGLGLAIHEPPSLGAVDMELRPGDVVTVEPGLYDPAVGGIRIEDLVVVTEDGCRNLTNFPKVFEL